MTGGKIVNNRLNHLGLVGHGVGTPNLEVIRAGGEIRGRIMMRHELVTLGILALVLGAVP